MTTVASVAELRSLLKQRFPVEYTRKMLHTIPDLPVEKERGTYLEALVKGRRILDIGCTGALSAKLKAAAAVYHGCDRDEGPWTVVDLDTEPERLPALDVDLVIASEVLEHLANPGRFLAALARAYPTTPCIFTVPNAGAYGIYDKCEMVNRDHVAWYSYTTLSTLLRRYTFTITEARWYNGQPYKAEGLIVHARVA